MSPARHRLRTAALVASLAMLAPFSLDTYLPSFPDIAHAFDAGPAQMQQTLSVYLLGFAAMTLVYGPLSDAYGRRGVVLVALVIYVLASAGCAPCKACRPVPVWSWGGHWCATCFPAAMPRRSWG